MNCFLWWRVREGKLDELECRGPSHLLKKLSELVVDGDVVVVMAEVHRELPNSEVLTK